MVRGSGSGCAAVRPGPLVFGIRISWIIIWRMVSLTDYQLRIVMGAAGGLPVEKRDIFLRRIAAMLALRGRGHFGDADVTAVAQLAGLVQQTVDVA
jgi:hypothetical protein